MKIFLSQGMLGPMPFPPVSITFDEKEESDTGAGGGMSSCDSFHQSTETVVMRDAAAAARKAAAAARRKSVYYNATPEPTTATSASSDADLVTLPRIKQRHHHHHHNHHQRHHHSHAEPEVDRITTLDRGGAASNRRHASRTENIGGGGSGRRRKVGISDVDVTAQEVTPVLNVRAPNNPASSKVVTQSTVHSDSYVAALNASVRFQAADSLRPHAFSNPGDTGGGGRPRVMSSTPAASSASTMRTYGPACVTVTPLTTVEECPKFPITIAAARDRSKQLNPADLLRREYETSFGGEVNPLVLYSAGGGATGTVEQEVNLSKQTVYDNVQYFNM